MNSLPTRHQLGVEMLDEDVCLFEHLPAYHGHFVDDQVLHVG